MCKMLNRNSVLPSKNANCLHLEDLDESISIGIFSLSYEKSIYVNRLYNSSFYFLLFNFDF